MVMVSASQVANTVSGPHRNRFALLDLLRFAAALAVLAYHYTAIKYANWDQPVSELFPTLTKFSKYGSLGVDLFFLISGFVILMSAFQRPAGHFVASRFSRIFPALWVMVVLGALMRWIIWPEKGGFFKFRDFLVNLTLVVEPSKSVYVDGVMWTLWTEMRFYLLIFFFILWGINQQRIVAVSLLWPVTAFIASQTENWFLAGFLMPGAAPLFAGGMMMFVIYKWGWSWLKAGVLLANVAWASLYSSRGAAKSIGDNTIFTADELKITIAIILIFTVVGVCVLTPVRSISLRWMTWLGLFTYPLYLVHELWGWFIIDKFAGVLPKYWVLLIATSVAFTLAYLIIKFVERPFAGRMRNRIIRDIAQMKEQDITESDLLDLKREEKLATELDTRQTSTKISGIDRDPIPS